MQMKILMKSERLLYSPLSATQLLYVNKNLNLNLFSVCLLKPLNSCGIVL